MSKRINVNPDHYKLAGRERQGENVIHEVERQEAARLRREEARARRQRAAGISTAGISNRLSGEDEARNQAEHPPRETEAPPQDSADAGEELPAEFPGLQTSGKVGIKSMAQKDAAARHIDEPAPHAQKVAGAFGREGQDREKWTSGQDAEAGQENE